MKCVITICSSSSASCSTLLLIMNQLLPEHLHDEIDQGAYYSSPSRSANRYRPPEITRSYNQFKSLLRSSYSSLPPRPRDVLRRSLVSSPSEALRSSRRHQRCNSSIRFYADAPTELEIEPGTVCTSTTTSAHCSRSPLTHGSTMPIADE